MLEENSQALGPTTLAQKMAGRSVQNSTRIPPPPPSPLPCNVLMFLCLCTVRMISVAWGTLLGTRGLPKIYRRRIKVSNFTSGWVQSRARRKTGNSRTVTPIQERSSGDFSIPQLFYMCKGRKLLRTKI